MGSNNQEQPPALDDSFASPTEDTKRAILCAIDFEPEDRPLGMIEATFLADEQTQWGPGVYELKFIRPLSREEWQARDYRPLLGDGGAKPSTTDASQDQRSGGHRPNA